MNETRQKIYPDGFPEIDELKHEIIEQLHPMDVSIPSSFVPIYIRDDSSFADMTGRLFTCKNDFFLGKNIGFNDSGYIRIKYYLFNDRIIFQHNHLFTLPKCPFCGNPTIAMNKDGSFKCDRKQCIYYLPSKTSYDPAMHEKAKIDLITHMIRTKGNAKPILIKWKMCYYMLELFSELKITLEHRYINGNQYELHYILPEGFHIEQIDCITIEQKARTVLKAQIELNPIKDGKVMIFAENDLIPYMSNILIPLLSSKKIKRVVESKFNGELAEEQSMLTITLGKDFDMGDI